MEIGLAVGGAFLSSALQVLFDRLTPQGYLFKMFQKHKHDVGLLEKLQAILLGLQIVLSNAENNQAANRHVSQWLNKLQNAVDSAENLIEEVNYEALRLKVEGQRQNLAETSNQQVSDGFFSEIKQKLEKTVGTLEDLQKQIGLLGLKEHFGLTKQETRRPSTSLIDESDVFGREIEIKELIDRLLSKDASEKNLSVVPIVGMGGVGKTTLVKAVYNDEKVKEHFGLKAWICVSEAYDAFRITKGLLQEIDSFDLKVDDNLNQLQVKLKERLKETKFLIVLDDVWNDNYREWDDLRNLFIQKEDMGSKIIVTTRKERVALMMGSGTINVGTLSSKASWDLLKRHSLVNRDHEEHPQLEDVGKKFADKCKGLPLALKALAGILRCKSEVDEWRDILRSEIWEMPSCANDILPALMLSYNDLPAHLKQCFAYCAIYPKDYQFSKDQVIHLWIANGLVQQFHSGKQYFLELKSRSLFERVPKSSKRDAEEFLMHDLVNDLAQIASSNLCLRLEENQGSHMLEKCRHMSYLLSHTEFEKLKPLDKLEQLRTLLPINIQDLYQIKLSKRVLHNILPTLTSLRALSLSPYLIKELPDALFIKLKLLRFLDLSQTEIKRLPDSICALYNLETLLLSSCIYLAELPPQMEKLINLRHLDISNTSCLNMSLHLSKLKRLQVLVGAKCPLGGRGGSGMGDLGEAHNLYGSLSILELQNVIDRREAQKANMREKNHVEKLSLEWSESIAENSQTEKDILDELCPHTNIKELRISGYRGTQFPNWLADHSILELLVQLSLSNCKHCLSLPELGQLPCLKFLSIIGMPEIREVTEEFYGSLSSKKPFNSLEKLEFADMPEWRQWHILGNGEFPTLQNLSIENSPKLMGKLPENLCSLTELRISRCPELNLETPIELSSLKKFEVDGSPKVGVVFDEAELFTSQLEGMKQIVALSISDCNSLSSLAMSILPNTLKAIRISGCRELKLEMPVGEMISSGYCNMFLEELRVVHCQNLTTFSIPTWTGSLDIRDCENLEILSSPSIGTESLSIDNLEILPMASLGIYNCVKLQRLPERMQEFLPSLSTLELSGCPEIESFPDGGLPFNLQVLHVRDCKKLVNRRKEWRLPRLRVLLIEHDGSDEEIPSGENWELPCSIQKLTIRNLKTLSSQVLKSLTSVEYLRADNLPQIQSLLEEGLPSSLSELFLSDHNELHSLPTEGLRHLTSLQSLAIYSCHQLQSLAESALPSSLSVLSVWNCPILQSLPKSLSVLPSSLSVLYVWNCPNLQSLPVKGMSSSLSKLSIYNCPFLKPLLEFDKGEHWSKIAHISEIYIEGQKSLLECL